MPAGRYRPLGLDRPLRTSVSSSGAARQRGSTVPRAAIPRMSRMASRIDVSIEQRGGQECRRACTAGFEHVSRCGSHYRDDELERPCGCAALRPPLSVAGAAAYRAARRRGDVRRIGGRARSADPLAFFDLRAYTERLAEAEMSTGLGDAMVVGSGKIERRDCQLAVMDFSFMGGSMGSVVGEARPGPAGLPSSAIRRLCASRPQGERGAGGNSLLRAASEDGLRGRGAARRAAPSSS